MMTWRDVEVARTRREDIHRDVERLRLAQEARVSSPLLHRRLLAWVGGWLVWWGTRLQARYGEVSGVQVVSHTRRVARGAR